MQIYSWRVWENEAKAIANQSLEGNTLSIFFLFFIFYKIVIVIINLLIYHINISEFR